MTSQGVEFKKVRANMSEKIPVVLDTDIGGDIDDTWALAMLLKSPELDLKLVVTEPAAPEYRARLVAKLLATAGRTDVAIGLGCGPGRDAFEYQVDWLDNYQLSDYPGTLYDDGAGALVRALHDTPEPTTLLCIGPVPTVAEALRREPALACKTRFVGMFGSIHRQHDGLPGAIAEFNVAQAIRASQTVLTAPWLAATITPLDTCGTVGLDGHRYRRCRDCSEPLIRAVLDNYRVWARSREVSCDPESHSTILFDTVAVHLAYTQRHLVMERMNIRVTDEAFTVADRSGMPFDVAVDWADYNGFLDELVERLTSEVVR